MQFRQFGAVGYRQLRQLVFYGIQPDEVVEPDGTQGGQSGFVYVSVFQLGQYRQIEVGQGGTLQVQYRHFGRFAQIQFRYPGAVQAKVRQLAQLVESEGGYRILAEVQGPEICQSFYRCGIRDAMEFQVEGFQRSEVLQPVQTFYRIGVGRILGIIVSHLYRSESGGFVE